MCFEFSKELSHWDGSFEYRQHMFRFRNRGEKKSITLSGVMSRYFCWEIRLIIFNFMEGIVLTPRSGLGATVFFKNADATGASSSESEKSEERKNNRKKSGIPLWASLVFINLTRATTYCSRWQSLWFLQWFMGKNKVDISCESSAGRQFTNVKAYYVAKNGKTKW